MFSEPTSCAMHGLESLQMRPGGSALVLGAGPTGLLLAQAHRHRWRVVRDGRGAQRVQARHREAGSASTRSCRSPATTPRATCRSLREASPHGDGYDAVIEATGSTAVAAICVPLTRRGGTVLVYGVTRDEEVVEFHPYDVFRREITIKGSFAEMTSFAAAIDALRGGRVRTDGIVTHRYSLDEYGQALDDLRNDKTVHKAVIVP
nr:zinc-binding dehydrogenase [Angustibacter aerolatus]